MPKINIDELCEPIVLIVGGKEYTIVDISQELAERMTKIGKNAGEVTDVKIMVDILSEVLNANKDDIAQLGIRKIGATIQNIFNVINGELEAKNAPKVEVKKSATIASAFPGLFAIG